MWMNPYIIILYPTDPTLIPIRISQVLNIHQHFINNNLDSADQTSMPQLCITNSCDARMSTVPLSPHTTCTVTQGQYPTIPSMINFSWSEVSLSARERDSSTHTRPESITPTLQRQKWIIAFQPLVNRDHLILMDFLVAEEWWVLPSALPLTFPCWRC